VTTPQPIASEEREAFYAAAMIGLRLLESRERTPRRFGADADERWDQFRGALGPGDRIDVLLRDAAGTWGPAFSPAQAFGLFGLALDEPFGPDWKSLADEKAKRLLSESTTDVTAAARAVGVEPQAVKLPSISPTTRIVIAGGAAVLAVADAFKANAALSWSDQVVVVATKPAHRQLAGLVAVSLAARGRTTVVRPGDDVSAILRAASFVQIDVAVVSADAEPEAAAFAERAKAGK
jgi:hypothetical protein